MSDPNQEFQPPPPPTVEGEPDRKRPVKLLWIGIVLVVLGIIVCVGGSAFLLDKTGIAYLLDKIGIAGSIPGGIGTGAAVCALGVLFSGLSFASLPYVPDAPPPMSTVGSLTGIFFEPTDVFRNLRAHPRWLAAILIMGCLNAAYVAAFYHRLTPERIVNSTMDKVADSPIKPPPEAIAQARQQGIEQEKSTTYQVGKVVKTIVGVFFSVAFFGALYLLGVLAFGGRMHFWQAYAVAAFVAFPVLVIQRIISFIILFIKSPDDIPPLIGQETLVTDNLGILFKAAEHPVLWVAASAIGILSFYKLWLAAKGLQEGGYKVSSSAGWGVAITLWVLGLLLGLASAAIFPSFFS
jgi:Yip1 domain